MWQLLLWLPICASGLALNLPKSQICGFPITIRSAYRTQRSTLVSCVIDLDHGCNSTKQWRKLCLRQPDYMGAMLGTSVSSTHGLWNGLEMSTLADLSGLRDSHLFLRMRLNYISGVAYTSLAGWNGSGQLGCLRPQYSTTLTVWTNLFSASPVLRKQCPGKLGRNWRFRFLPATPRRGRRRRPRRAVLAFNLVCRLLHLSSRMSHDACSALPTHSAPTRHVQSATDYSYEPNNAACYTSEFRLPLGSNLSMRQLHLEARPSPTQ